MRPQSTVREAEGVESFGFMRNGTPNEKRRWLSGFSYEISAVKQKPPGLRADVAPRKNLIKFFSLKKLTDVVIRGIWRAMCGDNQKAGGEAEGETSQRFNVVT